MRPTRRDPGLRSVTTAFLAGLILLSTVSAQTQKTPAEATQLLDKIKGLDSAFFDAYNRCEIAKMESLFTEDVEFYHEKRGVIATKKTVMEVLSNNLCGDKNNMYVGSWWREV